MRVGYYPAWERGPVKDFLDGLEKDGQRVKAAARLHLDVDKLGAFWPQWRSVNIRVKSMVGHKPLWELVREYDGMAYRIFFCVQKDQIWLLHAIEKKTQKTPQSDLDLAYNRMQSILKGGAS